MTELSERLQTALGDAFRLDRELAAGGKSRLFLATEASLNRRVVIKLLPPEMASDVSAARFKQEIELAAHLQHPNILPVLTAGASADLIYYVMPYVAGESLRHRLTTEGKLPVGDAVRIMHEVADALSYAHAHGVVHRDIKPENILLEQGHAVLTDFGVARAIAEARSGGRLTGTGMAVGTPAYMSPEQAGGERHVDARADVYSLAVVGYEMLAGASPFTGPSAQAVMAAHLTETPKPLNEVRADTPPAVTGVIAKALAKDPAERLQTAAEFRDAVSAATGGTPAAERPARRYAIIGAVVALVLAAVIAFWPRAWSVEGDPRKSLIVFPFENRTGDRDNDWLQEASMNLLGLSLAHWEDLRVFDDERTASLMRRRDVKDPGDLDFDAAQRMAREAHVGTLVIGDVRREGDSLTIEAKVHDVASGDRLATEIVRSDLTSDPRALFDSLSGRILRVSGAPPGERPGVVAQTTQSLDAYRAYLAGSDALQRFDLDPAEEHFLTAVELDSTFALAYIGLRNVEGWRAGGGQREKRRRLVAKAQAFSRALPPRLKTLVRLHAAYESDQFRRARAIAGQLIARDSGDVEAWYQLGEAHFHDGSARFPHPDTLGDLGKALQAFRRTLELDSSYILGYRHIIDALSYCASQGAPYVCFSESAAYGEPAELERRFGPSAVERLRRKAEDDLLEAAYGWVSAAPGSTPPRAALVSTLLARQQFEEASVQAAALGDLGTESHALAYEAQVLLGQRKFREAATRMREALAGVPDSLLYRPRFVYAAAPTMWGAAGLVQDARDAGQRFGGAWASSVWWPDTRGERVDWPVAAFRSWWYLWIDAHFSTDSARVRGGADRLLDMLRTTWATDTTTFRRVAGRQSAFLSAYLSSRDTVVLSRWLAASDSILWRSAQAHLALARRDTVVARRLLERDFDPGVPVRSGPWAGSNFSEDVPEAYAWADLLVQLGELHSAAAAYERLDDASYEVRWFDPHWGLLIRSYAERGALYQQLGDRAKAIEMYQKFVDAWGEGDETVQPTVERARAALAALRGEAATPRRR
ncbi:MAG: protein kinase [Gemmatimonadales bacterium]